MSDLTRRVNAKLMPVMTSCVPVVPDVPAVRAPLLYVPRLTDVAKNDVNAAYTNTQDAEKDPADIPDLTRRVRDEMMSVMTSCVPVVPDVPAFRAPLLNVPRLIDAAIIDVIAAQDRTLAEKDFADIPKTAANNGTKPDKLSMYYQNTRGLNSKIQSFYLAVTSSNYDVVILTETWLKSSISDTELFGDDFVVYRCDRNIRNSTKPHGGGVLIAINKNIPSQRLVITDSDQLEIIFIKCNIGSTKIFIVCIYIPSNSAVSVYKTVVDVLTLFLDKYGMSALDQILCVGDFNLPHVSWVKDNDNTSVLIPVNCNEMSSNLLDLLSSYALCQVNYVTNFMTRLLDLIFSNNTDNIVIRKCTCPLTIVDKFHEPLDFFLTLNNELEDTTSACMSSKYDFKKADFTSLNLFLENINWSSLFKSCDIQQAVSYFYEVLHIGFFFCVPMAKAKPHNNSPPWYTKELTNLKNKKNKAYSRYRSTLSDSNYKIYSDLRSKFKTQQTKQYKLYLIDVQQHLT